MHSTGTGAPTGRPPTASDEPPIAGPRAGIVSDGSPSPFNIVSFGLVRRFAESLTSKTSSEREASGAGRTAIDWQKVEAAVADSTTLEQAVGRAVVIADQMSRGVFGGERVGAPTPALASDEAFFAYSQDDVDPDFGDESRYRRRISKRMGSILGQRQKVATLAIGLLLLLGSVTAYAATAHGSSPAEAGVDPAVHLDGNAQLSKVQLVSDSAPPVATPALPASTTPPAAAPPSVADAPALRPHEVFAFAPYWTLDQSSGFDVGSRSTIAYFSLDVNPDGTLNHSGPGWDGYQSQALSDLITRAHAAGDRVVLTVTCFDQGALDALTSSTTAPTTLAHALVAAIAAKNLDGVNLDFEGTGSADQTGLTNLVTSVSAAVHAANPHYQVTMDTYASSAGDPNGFYNIKALAPAVDAFFVMEYQLNLQANSSAVSPLTSGMFSDTTAVDQYAASVPTSKVILGLPYFGIDWPTTDGTLTAQATGPATTPSYGQIVSSGHPIYWDQTTDTAWTSYQVGTQWHETFFEDPTSLYEAAQLAESSNLAGVGIWALGMDGNDPNMLSALLGFSPAVKDSMAGPAATSQSTPSTTTPSISSSSSTSTTSTSSPMTTSTSLASPATP
jgi:hypothetical protein